MIENKETKNCIQCNQVIPYIAKFCIACRSPQTPIEKPTNPFATGAKDLGICLEDSNCDDSEELEFPSLKSKKDLPKLTQQAKNLIGQSLSTFREMAIGKKPVVSKEEAETRLNICFDCPELIQHKSKIPLFSKIVKDRPRCVQCGCFMDIKVHVKTAVCPLDKWPKIKE